MVFMDFATPGHHGYLSLSILYPPYPHNFPPNLTKPLFFRPTNFWDPSFLIDVRLTIGRSLTFDRLISTFDDFRSGVQWLSMTFDRLFNGFQWVSMNFDDIRWLPMLSIVAPQRYHPKTLSIWYVSRSFWICNLFARHYSNFGSRPACRPVGRFQTNFTQKKSIAL